MITIDLATNKLYADRYGACYDRMVDLSTGECIGSNYDTSAVQQPPVSPASGAVLWHDLACGTSLA